MLLALLLLTISILFKFFQPKKINAFYGYRTSLSRKNIRNWKFANEYCATWLARVSLVLCIMALVVFDFSKSIADTEKMMIPFNLLGLILVIVRTELALAKYSRKMDQQGL